MLPDALLQLLSIPAQSCRARYLPQACVAQARWLRVGVKQMLADQPAARHLRTR